MQEMLDSNFAEIVAPDEETPINRNWCTPHHGVQQPDKWRVVFHYNSEFRGVSLNNMLQDPNLMNLLGIIFRFRLESIALTCDIQKMNHQYWVSTMDQDLLR